MVAFIRRVVPSLSRDGWMVFGATAVRGIDYSFLSVFLGVYLSVLEFSAFQAGVVFSGIMAGGAVSNVVASWKGDRIGRRRLLIVMTLLMSMGGALFALGTNEWQLAAIGLLAMTTTTGGDRTAFVSMDSAILAQSASERERTMVFSLYNLVSIVTKTGGALLIAVPELLQSTLGMEEVASYRAMFFGYAVVAMGGLAFYGALTPQAEVRAVTRSASPPSEGGLSARGAIIRIAALFSIDSLGGGFYVKSFIAYWFATKFGLSLNSITAVFFLGQLANVVSVLLAAPCARWIGLVNTMVFTQVVANVLIIALALSGNALLAVAFYVARELLNEMDVPTRQSYTMAIVPPESRMAMAGVTNLGRNVTQAASPIIGGATASVTTLGTPFLIGTFFKLLYNFALYLQFRSIKAPEELLRSAAANEGGQGR